MFAGLASRVALGGGSWQGGLSRGGGFCQPVVLWQVLASIVAGHGHKQGLLVPVHSIMH